jgi:putative spermidine/putrescine transport system permease protein
MGKLGHKILSHLRARWSTALLLTPAALLLLGFLGLPLVEMVKVSLTQGGAWSTAAYLEIFQTRSFWAILGTTFMTGAVTTTASVALGIPLAVVLVRVPPGWRKILLLMVTVPYFASVLIRSYAWVAMLSPYGLVNQVLMGVGLTTAPLRLAYTRLGMLVAMTQVQLPLMVLSVFSVLQRVDPRLARAARALGADPVTAFLTVTMPLCRPGIAAGAILVFTGALGFYVTPALLGAPGDYLLAQAIEQRVNGMNDSAGAAAQALTLLLLILVSAFLFRSSLAVAMGIEPKNQANQRRTLKLPRQMERVLSSVASLRWWFGGTVAGLTLVLLVLPVAILIPLAFSSAPYLTFPPPGLSLRWFQDYAGDPDWVGSTGFSLLLAGISAFIGLAVGTAASIGISRLHRTAQTAAMLMAVLPLLISHMVISVAVFFVSARFQLIGHPIMFVGTYVLLGLPFVVLVVSAALRRFDPTLLRAAASLGARPWPAARTVLLPILMPALLSGCVLAFLAAFDDVTVALFLSTPSTVPLPMRIWDSLRESLTPRAAAVAVILYGAASAVMALGALGRRSFFNLKRSPP